jgi:uncharacterized protein (DUF2235 family)
MRQGFPCVGACLWHAFAILYPSHSDRARHFQAPDLMETPVQDAASPPTETEELRRGKTIVIFADGTGNAYSVQESNIWRLYNALDKRLKPDGLQQIARYIPGVGTSSNRFVRALDGATGFGVPSNIRKLYRFLCWNWQPGDRIYLFGFSRGAFTVRALAGMLSMQGLMPREIDGRPVGSAEMSRNAAGAWRAYRNETAPLVKDGRLQMNPLISLVRLARDGFIWTKRAVMRQDQHSRVQAAQTGINARGAVKVRFLGVYDTVEAYGIPVKKVAQAVNLLVWPFQFRNQHCSPIVETVRHALALDDERLTFHPIRFDQRDRPDGKKGPMTREVWFAGMHSDVGGGYPDNAVALDPLVWMADEARAAGLTFDGTLLDRYRDTRYPQALIHDSRAGFASFYRYTPRRTDEPEANGAAPVLHPSAVAKMRFGANGYTPLILPERFDALVADDKAEAAPVPMRRDPEAQRRIARLIAWRKTTNLISVTCVLALVVVLYRSLYRACVAAGGGDAWCHAKAPFGLLVDIGWSWGALIADWPSILILAAGVVAVHFANLSLADAIKDHSRRLWQPVA